MTHMCFRGHRSVRVVGCCTNVGMISHINIGEQWLGHRSLRGVGCCTNVGVISHINMGAQRLGHRSVRGVHTSEMTKRRMSPRCFRGHRSLRGVGCCTNVGVISHISMGAQRHVRDDKRSKVRECPHQNRRKKETNHAHGVESCMKNGSTTLRHQNPCATPTA